MKLNGNLQLNTDATGEIRNAFIERLAAEPTFASGDKGRLYFNTTNATYYFNDGTAWRSFATGGNAAALQTEVDAIETSLGSMVNANGTWAGGLVGSVISGAGSVTAALNSLAAYAGTHDALAELADVTLTSPSTGQFLVKSAGNWVNQTLVLANVSDVTATAAEVNVLHGIPAGLTATELGYVDGVTSSIQTQLNGLQATDPTLTALSSLHSTGIVVETAQDVFTTRTLVAPSAGITITNADGISGNPTLVLAGDLAAVEGLAANGYAIRTGTSTWTTRAITGQAGRIVVTNGDGVASNTDLDLATISQAATGTFQKFTVDGYGRVTGTTNVVLSDITGLADSTYVNVAGDTMTGSLTFSAGTVTGLPDPVNASDAANKNYVDASVTGLTWKNSAAVATTVAGTLASSFAAGQVVDGYTLVLGDRIVIKNQAAGTENGIYVVTAGLPTRALDADTGAELNHATIFVEHGTTQAATGWTVNNAVLPVLGTDAITFVQFNGAASVVAGVGLSKSGNTIDVNLGAGIVELPNDEVGIDLYSTVNALRLTTDGSTPSTATAAKLTLVLKSAGGLTQDANGLYVPAAGIANTMLANPAIGLNADSGSSSLPLGDTLYVVGTSVQGISVAVASATPGANQSQFKITAADASSSQKGVASFDATEFSVSTGNVVLGTVPVGKIANAHIGFTGNTGTPSDVTLGNNVSILGSGSISTVASASTITVSVATATTGALGVASFSATDFAVSSGAVSLVAKGLNSLTDVVTASDVAGQTLVYSTAASKFVNRTVYFLYDGSTASTSHVVAHNLGQKYCNVTVVDATDEVVIPQSITFTSATSLTVTFTSSIACKVVVMGVNAG